MKIKLFFLASFLFINSFAGDDWIKKEPSGNLPFERFGHALAYAGDDKVLCFGGNGGPGTYANDTWVYDLSENTWTELNPPDPFPSIRRDLAMSYIGEDHVLLFGGYYPAYLGDTWLYTLSTNTWVNLSPPVSPPERYSHAMCYLGDDKVLLHGGVGAPAWMDDMWVFDLSENNWSEISPSGVKPSPRHYHEVVPIAENKMLLFGGYDTAHTQQDTWLYDVSLNTWTELSPIGNIPSHRFQHSMVPIGDNKVMMFGGSQGYYILNNETWIYDLDYNTWTEDENTIFPPELYQHETAQTCLDGKRYVVLFGGASSSGEINETWTFGGGDYITDIKSEEALSPVEAVLEQNYPNPFNPSTKITFRIPKAEFISLIVYDVLGKEAAILLNEERSAGTYDITFNAGDLAAGVYFYRIQAGNFIDTKKFILMK